MIEPEYYETWYDNATGEKLDWYLNEHCFVLAGFNIANSTVTLNDPMKGIIDYNIDKFEIRFKQMYSQAIVIIPDSAEAVTETAAVVTETEELPETSDVSADISEEIFSETTSVTEETTETEETVTIPSETEPPADESDFFTGSFIYD